ncbi:uncharacterized protein J3D65DRAFT_600505 [Phyllosticta citribraziliensis]|uniref:Uncharacterized protein n=1 Tax=Phyllosticta citribraziliensis TaxID=989973 RepID=A0ABR1M5C5_9PEZI
MSDWEGVEMASVGVLAIATDDDSSEDGTSSGNVYIVSLEGAAYDASTGSLASELDNTDGNGVKVAGRMPMDVPVGAVPDAGGVEVGNVNGRMENTWSDVSAGAASDVSRAEAGNESSELTEIGSMEKIWSLSEAEKGVEVENESSELTEIGSIEKIWSVSEASDVEVGDESSELTEIGSMEKICSVSEAEEGVVAGTDSSELTEIGMSDVEVGNESSELTEIGKIEKIWSVSEASGVEVGNESPEPTEIGSMEKIWSVSEASGVEIGNVCSEETEMGRMENICSVVEEMDGKDKNPEDSNSGVENTDEGKEEFAGLTNGVGKVEFDVMLPPDANT